VVKISFALLALIW